MIDDSRRVAVVGAGHSGTAAAALLRQHGFTGPLTLLGAERHVPYHRPPLSKSAQGSGSGPPDLLRPAGFYPDQRIELRLDTPVRALDPAAHVLHLGDGSELRYDVAILATGAWPRRIPVPGADLPGVHILRTLDDARRLGDDLGPGRRLVVVGGGYIGLEVASTARRLGTQVTVLEAAERVLGRSAGLDIAAWLTDRHRAQGTGIALGAAVDRFEAGADGRVAAVGLADGSALPCDVALVGVGAQPCDELARAAGLRCDDGVVVDDRARTSAADVHAIGDMTRRPILPLPGAAPPGEHPQRGRAGQAGGRRPARPAGAEAGGAVVLVGPVRPEAQDRRAARAHREVGGARRPRRRPLRGVPPRRRGARRVGRDRQRGWRVHAGKKWIAESTVVDPDGLADPSTSLRTLISRGAP
jgi:3-phenylpropionate/trans-cinnamate dioxygenase ferredoxin reductase component